LAGYLGEYSWRKSLERNTATLKLVAKYHTGQPQTETIATQYHASDIYHLHERGQVVSFEEFIIIREAARQAKDAKAAEDEALEKAISEMSDTLEDANYSE
jgi:hypothetical protein